MSRSALAALIGVLAAGLPLFFRFHPDIAISDTFHLFLEYLSLPGYGLSILLSLGHTFALAELFNALVYGGVAYGALRLLA